VGGPLGSASEEFIFWIKLTKTDHSASLLRNITFFHTRKSNIVAFSQTIGQKNTSIFQNCPRQPHEDQIFLKNKKVRQKWLKKSQNKKFFAVLASPAQGLSDETPTTFIQ
jgi:hypothetical protein